MSKIKDTIQIIAMKPNEYVVWRCTVCNEQGQMHVGERIEHRHLSEKELTAVPCTTVQDMQLPHDSHYVHDLMQAQHHWLARVEVNELQNADGFIYTYSADVRIECTDCHAHMKFNGLSRGSSMFHPTVSWDEQSLRVPMDIVV